MTHCKTYGQRGVALIMALMLLMLLTALAAALVFVANMETAVNANLSPGAGALFCRQGRH